VGPRWWLPTELLHGSLSLWALSPVPGEMDQQPCTLSPPRAPIPTTSETRGSGYMLNKDKL